MKSFIIKAGAVGTAVISAGTAVVGLTADINAESSKEINNKINQSNNELSELENTLKNINSEINSLDSKATDLISKMYDVNRDLENTQKELDKQYSDMKYRIQYNYENGNKSLTESLISSKSFAEVLNTAEYYQKIYSYDRGKLDEIKKTADKISYLKEELNYQIAEMNSAKEEMSNKQKELDNLITSKKSEIEKLNTEFSKALLEEEQARKKAEEEARAAEAKRKAELERIEREQREQAEKAALQAQENNKESYDGDKDYSNTTNNSSKPSGNASLREQVARNAAAGNSTFPALPGWCAAWVSGVYSYTGITPPRGNAIDYWLKWSSSGSTSMSNIPVGACVISSGWGAAGAEYGHIGIYLGDGMVASNVGYIKIQSIQSFDSDATATCRGYQGYIGWVWPNGNPI